MSAIKKYFWAIWEKLFGSLDNGGKPSNSFFLELDVEKMKSQMELSKRAKEQGNAEMPAFDSEGFDEIERQIVREIDVAKKDAFEKYLLHLNTYGEMIGSLGFQEKIVALMAVPANGIVELRVQNRNGKNELLSLRLDVFRINKESKIFRDKHDLLYRVYRGPDSRVWHWGIISILICFETIFNGFFLAQGHSIILVGFAEAFVIACLNVFVGVLVGWKILPWIFHRSLLAKLWGVLGGILYLGAAFFFNLVVAHYRDALGSDAPELAVQYVMTSLIASPFGLTHMPSWLLLAMGLTFSFIATVDGWFMDDPYPGFGPLLRKKDQIETDYSETYKDQVKILGDIKDQILEEVKTLGAVIETKKAQRQAILGWAALKGLLHSQMDHLEQSCNELLSTYRSVNIAARKTSPPAYFSEQWKIDEPEASDYRLEQYLGDQKLEDEISQVFTRMNESISTLFSIYEKCVNEYQLIEELSQEQIEDRLKHGPDS